jgi:hypothetical protein
MNLEVPALCAGYFGAWFGGPSGAKWRSETVLQVHIRQPRAVQQDDLPLRLAEEVENTLAVEL